MDGKKPISTRPDGFSTPSDRLAAGSQVRALATKDHDAIRQWAGRHHAEPATGEATTSGPATITVKDGGAGIRFNFPGFARFRPISWEEWFENFDQHQITFVFEEEVADRAYEYWQSRGGGDGHDREDWLHAEHEIGGAGRGASARYRLVRE